MIASGVEATAAFEQASREEEAATLAEHAGEPFEHPIPKRAKALIEKGAPPSVAFREAVREHVRRKN